jgi:pyruvate formate lyase activating enzyme
MERMEALILDIQRMSTEDGPGLRTTVFFKGCNLRCPWCHNPESISRKPDLNWYRQRCINCGLCVRACPQGAVSRGPEGVRFDRGLCRACGACAEECPNGAIELKGRPIQVDALAGELLKDRAYFGAEGGVTFSGGEAMLQREAVLALAKALKGEGLHIALDTAGCYPFAYLEEILPWIDLVLYDLKIFDSEAHRSVIGADNAVILENYRKLAEMRFPLWVRTPVIPGATDSGENIHAVGGFIASLPPPEKWELCAFNNLCRDKYERLDREWAYRGAELTKKAHIENLAAIARRYTPRAEYSGTTGG